MMLISKIKQKKYTFLFFCYSLTLYNMHIMQYIIYNVLYIYSESDPEELADAFSSSS